MAFETPMKIAILSVKELLNSVKNNVMFETANTQNS